MKPLFQLGTIVSTPGALAALHKANVNPLTLIERHVMGDWGDGDAEAHKENVHAVKHHFRVLSEYHLPGDVVIWIITEHDRSVTTVLLPSEY